jgi:hypothetical protein
LEFVRWLSYAAFVSAIDVQLAMGEPVNEQTDAG